MRKYRLFTHFSEADHPVKWIIYRLKRTLMTFFEVAAADITPINSTEKVIEIP
jgi:hypothetical protein